MSSLPIDSRSAERLQRNGLRLDLVDTADREVFGRWLHAENRGFHAPGFSEESAQEAMDGIAYRRTTGVWDGTGADPLTPVATVNSFATPLTVPGGRSVDSWAISGVTVSSTHRRRGIARALLEAELRTAVAQQLPVAILTVSESTIYGRFGFAPAVLASDYEIDARKAAWTGPAPAGRVQFVPTEQLLEQATALVERVRLTNPGEIETWPRLWERALGQGVDDKDYAKKLRAVRYDDADGTPQGFALYTLKEHESDYSRHTATVRQLVAATDDAYAGLVSFLLELDLTSTVVLPLRSVDEPLRWQVSDFRAVRVTDTRDHLWVRILNVIDALEAREYVMPVRLVLDVSDDLGFAAGRFELLNGVVTQTSADPDLSLSVNELGAVYLGGVSPLTLQRAGRITEHTPGAVESMDAAFRSPRTPWLSEWF